MNGSVDSVAVNVGVVVARRMRSGGFGMMMGYPSTGVRTVMASLCPTWQAQAESEQQDRCQSLHIASPLGAARGSAKTIHLPGRLSQEVA